MNENLQKVLTLKTGFLVTLGALLANLLVGLVSMGIFIGAVYAIVCFVIGLY